MCAKLLDFYGIMMNNQCIQYMLMEKDKNGNIIKPLMFEFSKMAELAGEDVKIDIREFIFGAQSSMITRNCNSAKMYKK